MKKIQMVIIFAFSLLCSIQALAEKNISNIGTEKLFGYSISKESSQGLSLEEIKCPEPIDANLSNLNFKVLCENNQSTKTRIVFLIKKFSFSGFEVSRDVIGTWIQKTRIFETDGNLICSRDKTFTGVGNNDQSNKYSSLYDCIFSHSNKDYPVSVLYFNPNHPVKETGQMVLIWNLKNSTEENKTEVKKIIKMISDLIKITPQQQSAS